MKKVNECKLNTLGVILFKPLCPAIEIVNFVKYCKEHNLSILFKKSRSLSSSMVIALYPKIFSFNKDDITHGILWKHKVISYHISSKSTYFLVDGKEVWAKLKSYKQYIRKKYKKISYPPKGMSEKDVVNRVIKNHIHVVDKSELQNSLWLLFYN